jgi:hypothetical protein
VAQLLVLSKDYDASKTVKIKGPFASTAPSSSSSSPYPSASHSLHLIRFASPSEHSIEAVTKSHNRRIQPASHL